MTNRRAAFWSIPGTEWLEELQTQPEGLTSAEARERLARYGPNRIKAKRRTDALTLFLTQFESPIILILLFAAGLSLFLSDAADASLSLRLSW